MNTAKIFAQPLTAILGLEVSDNAAYLLQMPVNPNLLNHVNTVHAAALYGFAELTNGYFLNVVFPEYAENTIPLVRSSKSKYKKLANGQLYSRATITNGTPEELSFILEKRKRVQIIINVEIFDQQGEEVFWSDFEWFVTFKPQPTLINLLQE